MIAAARQRVRQLREMALLTAANVNFVAFAEFWHDMAGQVFALFVIAIAAAEVAIGLAILLSLYKQRDTIELDMLDLLRW